MSGLARLLAGHTAPGVYHWPSPAEVADIEHAAHQAGWHVVVLDTWQVDDKAGFLDACRAAFDFPHWTGHNFDALADALSEVRPGDATGVLVLWDGWGVFARSDRRAFDVAVDVFADRVEFERGGTFAVVLRGPGPDDVQLPELDPHPH